MTERFTLLSELGRGGMGVVWKARDEQTGTVVALKLLHPVFAADPDYVTRFERELELSQRIHSANVVAVLGYGVREGTPYLALEFVGGPSLRERLTSHGPFGWADTKLLLAQIAQGLADAHAAGVIHRDLKPSNVLIGSDGTAKLADFGISKGLDLTRVTGTSTLLGTPAYLAPEGPADERSDLYSLGVIAFELLTGDVPFEGRTYQEVILRHVREAPDLGKLPPDARPVVGWLMAKEPAARPQRAVDLSRVLEGAVEPPPEVTPAARPSPTASPPTPPEESSAISWGEATPEPSPRTGGVTRSRAELRVARHTRWRRLGSLLKWTVPPTVVSAVLVAAVTLALPLGWQPVLAPPGPTSSLRVGAPSSPSPSPTPVPQSVPMVAAGVPKTSKFSLSTSSMTTARDRLTATLLKDGRVLIAGGAGDQGYLASTELYNPTTGTFDPAGSMTAERADFGAAILSDGRVLMVGGANTTGILTSAELYDPSAYTFATTGPMSIGRTSPTITPLGNGQVLVAGGGAGTIDPAELYTP